MFTNRLITLFVVIALAAVIAFTAQALFPALNGSYRESTEQILREYQLGERYGETSQNSDQFSADQILREYVLGERYGVAPKEYTDEQALREYWLGERYGVTP